MQMKKANMRLTKKPMRAQIKKVTKIKTAMCLSKEEFDEAIDSHRKRKKIGLNTSREAPKKLKNT